MLAAGKVSAEQHAESSSLSVNRRSGCLVPCKHHKKCSEVQDPVPGLRGLTARSMASNKHLLSTYCVQCQLNPTKTSSRAFQLQNPFAPPDNPVRRHNVIRKRQRRWGRTRASRGMKGMSGALALKALGVGGQGNDCRRKWLRRGSLQQALKWGWLHMRGAQCKPRTGVPA